MNLKSTTINIFSCFFAMVNNIFLLPKIIYDVNSNSRSLTLSLPFFMGALAFLLQPTYEYDLYRIFEGYKTYAYSEFSLSENLEFYLTTLYYIVNKFQFNVHFIPFISSFILYFVIAKIHYDNVNSSESCTKYLRLLTFFIMFMSVPFLLFSGIRFSTSIAVFLLGWHLFYRGSKLLGVGLVLASFSFHFSMILPTLLFLISLLTKFSYSRKFKILVIIVCAILGFLSDLMIDVMTSLVLNFNSVFGLAIDYTTYVTGLYGVERSSSFNETGRMVFLIKNYGLVFILFALNWRALNRNGSRENFLFYLFSFCLLSFNFATIFGRYSQLLIILSLSCCIYDIAINKRRLFNFCLLLLTTIYFLLFRFIEIKNNLPILLSSYSDFYKFSYFNIILQLWS